jgi:hypothetical protein
VRSAFASAFVWLLMLTSLVTTARAQEVSIPDPGLNAAIRQALQKFERPLTSEDMLGLTNLNASYRNVGYLDGLGAASNLTVLDLSYNSLSKVDLPTGLTKLASLNLDGNQLTDVTLPQGLTNLATLNLASGGCPPQGPCQNRNQLVLVQRETPVGGKC